MFAFENYSFPCLMFFMHDCIFLIDNVTTFLLSPEISGVLAGDNRVSSLNVINDPVAEPAKGLLARFVSPAK